MAQTPQDHARWRLRNGVEQIEQALRDWQNQASDAIDAWDGEGSAPVLYATEIRDVISDRASMIADETEEMMDDA